MRKHWKQKLAVLVSCTVLVQTVMPVMATTVTEAGVVGLQEAQMAEVKITGFVPLGEEEREVVLEPKKPLEEVVSELGDSLEVYLGDNAEPVSIEVEWECTQDYEALTTGTYYFVPVWDTQVYELLVDADAIPQKQVTILDEIYEVPELNYREIEGEEDVPEILDDIDYCGPDYGVLPTKYNPLDEGGTGMPEIRNQNPYGTCWTFSSLGMGEVNQYVKNGKTFDLSELHLAYFAYHSVVDPLGGLDGDSNALESDDPSFLESGGSLALSYNVLANWVGAAAEETAPYEEAEDALTNGLEDSIAYEDVLHLQGAYKINLQEEPDVAKQMISQYGGIGASYYHSNACYNYDYYSYYNNVNTSTNHAIMIVGWDDEFPKENFNSTASQDGAWLIRNSWGGYQTYSMYSYFWMSYDDTSLSDVAYVFEYEDADNYDNNYQYDGSMQSSNLSYGNTKAKAANVFTAKANPNGNELLKAVGFEVMDANVNYEIDIYLNPTDASDPESGTKVESAHTTGTTSLVGYYTVDLNESVFLEEGTVFAVVITYSKTDGSVKLPMEAAINAWYITTTSAKQGQSFIGYVGGNYTSWKDCVSYDANVRIKAFTDSLVPVTGIIFDVDNKELLKGESFTIGVTLEPEDAKGNLTWTSSNPTVASVDDNGRVTALKTGATTITAATNGVSASCVVTVKSPATSISLSSEAETLGIGSSMVLSATVLPEDTTDKVIWESSDPNVVEVNDEGEVVAKSKGTAVITATAGAVSRQCVITVEDSIPVENIELEVSEKTMEKGESFCLNATVTPTNTNSKLRWSSSAPSIASVDSNGNVKALEAGVATITASADGVSASCTIMVTVSATSISLNSDYETLKVGDSFLLRATVLPEDVTDTLKWTTSDAKIVSVDQNGKVTANKSGTATITATAGAVSAQCTIMVKSPATALTLDETSKTIGLGEEVILKARLMPADCTDTLNWTSSDEDIVTVDEYGRIKGWNAGNAVITVSAGEQSATCNVTVSFPFSDLTVNRGNWKYDSVAYVYANGIMNGISGTDWFQPDAPLTRAMFATVLYRMAGSPDTAYTTRFSDVIDGKWYSNAIIWANNQKIVSGLGDGSYGININITREQIAKMLYEYARTEGYDISTAASLASYTDDETVSGWATGYMRWAVGVGMISGKPNGDGSYRLDPKGEATRAECAAMLMRFQNKYK